MAAGSQAVSTHIRLPCCYSGGRGIEWQQDPKVSIAMWLPAATSHMGHSCVWVQSPVYLGNRREDIHSLAKPVLVVVLTSGFKAVGS